MAECFFCGKPCMEAQRWPDMPVMHFYCDIAATLAAHGYDAFVIAPEPDKP